VPGGLTLSQRLTGPDGLPTLVARAGAVALVCAGAALGYAAGPDGDGPPAERSRGAVAISRLSGELPIATPEPRPALTAATALPAFREVATSGSRVRQAPRAATPAPQPPPTARATPEPAATPEPVSTTAPPARAVPAPAPAPAPTAPPAPSATPAPTFDIEG
jgi:hypothetical protein